MPFCPGVFRLIPWLRNPNAPDSIRLGIQLTGNELDPFVTTLLWKTLTRTRFACCLGTMFCTGSNFIRSGASKFGDFAAFIPVGAACATRFAIQTHTATLRFIGLSVKTERHDNMQTFRVALSFARLPDSDLSAFANTVIVNMTGNAAFSQPPVPFTELAQLNADFRTAVSAAMDGGVSLTVAKQTARQALVSALRKTAAYVQIVADQDRALLLAAGFPTASRSRTRTKLSRPVILAVENYGTTKLAVRMPPVSNARSYEVRATNGGPAPAAAVISTQARRVVLEHLTPGTVYTIQARAIGGSEGYSEWCDPTTHMAM